jgi:hypothetical protein
LFKSDIIIANCSNVEQITTLHKIAQEVGIGIDYPKIIPLLESREDIKHVTETLSPAELEIEKQIKVTTLMKACSDAAKEDGIPISMVCNAEMSEYTAHNQIGLFVGTGSAVERSGGADGDLLSDLLSLGIAFKVAKVLEGFEQNNELTPNNFDEISDKLIEGWKKSHPSGIVSVDYTLQGGQAVYKSEKDAQESLNFNLKVKKLSREKAFKILSSGITIDDLRRQTAKFKEVIMPLHHAYVKATNDKNFQDLFTQSDGAPTKLANYVHASRFTGARVGEVIKNEKCGVKKHGDLRAIVYQFFIRSLGLSSSFIEFGALPKEQAVAIIEQIKDMARQENILAKHYLSALKVALAGFDPRSAELFNLHNHPLCKAGKEGGKILIEGGIEPASKEQLTESGYGYPDKEGLFEATKEMLEKPDRPSHSDFLEISKRTNLVHGKGIKNFGTMKPQFTENNGTDSVGYVDKEEVRFVDISPS